jgi:uncharacterized LabA/DUF88 family protein
MSKIAILIDGGFFLKRLRTVFPGTDPEDPEAVCFAIRNLATSHLKQENEIAGAKHERSLLYRIFYYDAKPYLEKEHYPVSKRGFDYSKTKEAKFRLGLFAELRKSPATAVRLGEVRRERGWVLKDDTQKALLNGKAEWNDIRDEDFAPGLRQKTVDMKIGIDIASLSLKRQVDTIILVSGDEDFVPAAKLARREGVKVILDPLWRSVSSSLFEHIDGVKSGAPKPKPNRKRRQK